MVIVKDMKAVDGMLKDGTVYEPESKKTYYALIFIATFTLQR